MTFHWTDLRGALLPVLVGLVVLTVLIALVVWYARRRKSRTIVIDIAATVATLWLAYTLLGMVLLPIYSLSVEWVELPVLPISMPWPTPLECATGDDLVTSGPSLDCAHLQATDASITGVSVWIRILVMLGRLSDYVLAAVPAFLILVICRQIRRGKPFARVAQRWMLVSAGVLLVAGLGGGLATSVGAALASAAVLPPPGAGPVTSPEYPSVYVPVWTIGVAIGLAALATVFHYGDRLQAEKDRLQKDTEGLV